MTEAAAVSSIPLATVIDGEFQDGSLQTDPLLQFGSYIGAEPNNNVLLNEGKGPNLTPALAGTTLEMQKTALAAEVVMLVHQVNVERPNLLPGEWKFETKICHVDREVGVRYVFILPSQNTTSLGLRTTLEMQKTVLVADMLMPVHQVNVEKPSLLSGEWKFETQIYHVDKPSETPQSKKQTSGSKTKKVTSFHFDSANPPKNVIWVLTNSNEDTWKPFVDGSMVPETQKHK